MAYNNGIVTAPVSINDVQRALGSGNTDLGTLCTDTSINKWAWYKPIKYTKIGMLSENDRKNAFYGLFFRENTAAKNLLKSSSPTVDMFNAAASSNYEWSYIRPMGGAASPYRLTDFVGETNNKGYKHATKPPFDILGDWTVEISKLNNVANTYSVVTTGNNYEWGINIYTDYTNAQEIYVGNIFVGYRMTYDGSPQYDINGPDPDAIPMTYLLAKDPDNNYNINLNGANWRIGMIVLVPGLNNGSPHVGLFVSKKNIKDSSGVSGENVRDLSVEMCTNQELALAMYRYMSGKTEYKFRALPVLVKDVKISQSPKQSTTDIARTSVNIDSSPDTKIYPLPTGSVEIGISVVGEQSGGGDEDKSTSGNFTLGTKWVASAGYEPVNVITITSTSPITKARTAYLDIDYEDAEGTHTLLNRNCSIPAGSQFDAQGVTYNGVTLNGGVRLRITTIRTFIVS